MTEHWRTPHRPREPFDWWKFSREGVMLTALILAWLALAKAWGM